MQLDTDGKVIASTAPSRLNDARIRRAQALAASSPVGIEVVRELLRAKLAGQSRVVRKLAQADGAIASITAASNALGGATSASEFRLLEAAAAAAYWGAWADLPVRFARRDQDRVPEHWRSFGTRSSPLTGSSRKAVNPPNALLNYLYALLEAETAITIRTAGLDPGIGVLHADQRGRDSLALDIMEAVRPEADEIVLELLAGRVFSAREFFETRGGDCRLVAPLPRQLAQFVSALADPLGAVVEHVMKQIDTLPAAGPGALGRGRSGRLPTPLTQQNRSDGREGVRQREGRRVRAPTLAGSWCAKCGGETSTGRAYCNECLSQYRAEQRAEFASSGPSRLAELRAQGTDPTATPEARERMRRRRSEQRKADREWETGQGTIPPRAVFEVEILPLLASVPLRAMEAATGLSLRQCSRIRRGDHVPHPRHWEGLQRMAIARRQSGGE